MESRHSLTAHPPAATGLHGSYHRQICNLVELFTEHGRSGRSSSPTFRLWDDFPVKIMTHWKSSCMSTTRKWNGLWQENQEIMAEFLPLLFPTNRISYAHYQPVSVLLMNRLPGYQATRWCIDSIWAKGLCGQVVAGAVQWCVDGLYTGGNRKQGDHNRKMHSAEGVHQRPYTHAADV